MYNGYMNIENICSILTEIWTDYKYDDEFKDFIEYNDLGLPLAVVINEDIVSLTPRAQVYIEETWILLLHALGIEDKEYDSLGAMFFEAGRA